MSGFRFRALLCVVAQLVWLAACQEKPGITLVVSSEVQQLLPVFSRQEYSGADILAVLDAAQGRRKDWCARPGIESGLGRELTQEEREAFAQNGLGLRLLLGCDAFVNLSDAEPRISMAYALEKLDPMQKARLDCVSVGFVQPYLLAAGGRCSQLTIVDTSFRTLRLHAALLPLLLSDNFGGIAEVYKQFHRTTGQHINDLCGAAYSEQCKLALAAFVNANRGKLKVLLHLGQIQRFDFANLSTRPLVYLSNSTDPHLMTSGDFDALIAGMSVKTGVLAIYHQAESTNFGVYDVKPGSIEVICADEFKVSRKGHYTADRCAYIPARTDRYKTYFDDRAQGTPRRCDFLENVR